MRRLKTLIPILLLVGLLCGLCPSMLAVRTAHADQTDTSTTQADMMKGDVPQPAAKNADTDEPMPLTDADVAIQSAQVP